MTTFTDDYDSLGQHWPSRSNVFESPTIQAIFLPDAILQLTPYAMLGLAARGMACLPTGCTFTGFPASDIDTCVQASNWTSCDCMITGLPTFAGEAIPDKLNADKEISVVLRFYTAGGVQSGQVVLTAGGWLSDFAGAYVPGAVFYPSWIYSPPTTNFAKTYCNTMYNIKECWTLYIGEDIEASGAVMAPVGGIVMATIFLGLDLLTFMTLFMVAGGGAKVGPAK
jgi:hypothetical protein